MNDNVKALTKLIAYLNLMYLEAKQEGVNYANTELKTQFTPFTLGFVQL